MKNSLALVITENDKNHIRTLYKSNEQISKINSMMGLIMEQSNKTIRVQGTVPYVGDKDTNWDRVHGILSSVYIDDDLDKVVGDELKEGNYRVINVSVFSYLDNNQIVTKAAAELRPVTGNEIPHRFFTTIGCIGNDPNDYLTRYDTEKTRKLSKLKEAYNGKITEIGPYVIPVEGTEYKFKQIFFAIEDEQSSDGNKLNSDNKETLPDSPDTENKEQPSDGNKLNADNKETLPDSPGAENKEQPSDGKENKPKVNDNWFYLKDDKVEGPVTLEDLKNVLDNKTLVWNKQLIKNKQWVRPTDDRVKDNFENPDLPPPPRGPIIRRKQEFYKYEPTTTTTTSGTTPPNSSLGGSSKPKIPTKPQ